jgi:hypothetical protein
VCDCSMELIFWSVSIAIVIAIITLEDRL